MSAYDKILAGIEDALAFARGDKSRGKVHRVHVSRADAVEQMRRRIAIQSPSRHPVVPAFATFAAGWAWLETLEGRAAQDYAVRLIACDSDLVIDLFVIGKNEDASRAWWDLQSQ